MLTACGVEGPSEGPTDLADADPDAERRPGVPLGRVGSAHEIAAVVALLCRDEAASITGANIPVDGGWTIQ